jgi:hypothetical protein
MSTRIIISQILLEGNKRGREDLFLKVFLLKLQRNLKDILGKKYSSGICLEGLRKPTISSLKIVRVRAKIQIKYLPNTSIEKAYFSKTSTEFSPSQVVPKCEEITTIYIFF